MIWTLIWRCPKIEEYPSNGWFVMENPRKMMTGGTPISGNHHLYCLVQRGIPTNDGNYIPPWMVEFPTSHGGLPQGKLHSPTWDLNRDIKEFDLSLSVKIPTKDMLQIHDSNTLVSLCVKPSKIFFGTRYFDPKAIAKNTRWLEKAPQLLRRWASTPRRGTGTLLCSGTNTWGNPKVFQILMISWYIIYGGFLEWGYPESSSLFNGIPPMISQFGQDHPAATAFFPGLQAVSPGLRVGLRDTFLHLISGDRRRSRVPFDLELKWVEWCYSFPIRMGILLGTYNGQGYCGDELI